LSNILKAFCYHTDNTQSKNLKMESPRFYSPSVVITK